MRALELVDYGVMGEGEKTICELCESLQGSYMKIHEIKGVVYRNEKGEIIKNDEREDISDLDNLPFPDYEGFDYEKHVNLNFESTDISRQLNSSYIIGSRSCPFNCTFCFHTSGKKYRQRSLDNIFEEIHYLVERYNLRFIGIQDELFSNKKERVLEFCERIKKYKISWFAQFRVSDIDEEIVKSIKDSGCQLIGLGLESADNLILKSMKKNITVEEIERALKIIETYKIPFIGSFIFGDKEETFMTAQNTLNWWKKNSNYRIDLRLITVFPGSNLYHYAIEKGIIKDPVEFLKKGCPQINISKMTDNEFASIAKQILTAPTNDAVDFEEYVLEGNKLEGKCVQCGIVNTFTDISFFSGTYLACKECGKKYNITIFPEIINLIDKKVTALIDQYKSVAIWSINYYTAFLLEKTDILNKSEIYVVDISNIKQDMEFKGKKILNPSVIREKDIKVVIVGVPSYKMVIEAEIREKFRNVQEIVNICDLVK